ncbi:Bidirectional sugar transporter SWEET [Heracleum sosnowskyi]|uniref:Bidirectional sugar transporter SWEET n=1 Tax=Heracleum sosnowskyi TaxID=360622 RepID=A0AAD8GU87_9APIA|nr:Bidirectional sugar transporter SWEET [Heracleum sosnowskyi]
MCIHCLNLRIVCFTYVFNGIGFFLGNFISFGRFASPVPTFYRAVKNDSVEGIEPEYYLLMTLNCLLWLLYSMPFIHPGSILVSTANGIGLVIHLAYLIIFIIYAKDNKQRACLVFLHMVGLVSGLVIGLADDVVVRTGLVGALAIGFGTMTYLPLLSGVLRACREESVEHMPFRVALISILNDLCWIIYASLGFDVCLLFTYCFGILIGVLQLLLHCVHSGDDKKLATDVVPVQLPEIDTGDDKKPCTAEVDP